MASPTKKGHLGNFGASGFCMVETNTQRRTAPSRKRFQKKTLTICHIGRRGRKDRCIIKGANSHFGLLESKILVKKTIRFDPPLFDVFHPMCYVPNVVEGARRIEVTGSQTNHHSVTLEARQTRLSLSPNSVIIHKNGIEFRSSVGFAPWMK